MAAEYQPVNIDDKTDDDDTDYRPSFWTSSATSRRLHWAIGVATSVLVLVLVQVTARFSTSIASQPTQPETFSALNMTIEWNEKLFSVTPTAYEQIQHYRRHQGLMINVHITHHAGRSNNSLDVAQQGIHPANHITGTTICHAIGRAPSSRGAPSKFCNHPGPEQDVSYDYPNYWPWSHEDTEPNYAIVHQYFDMIGWEFSHPSSKVPLADSNWESPHIVSVLVLREPISRLLAHDGSIRDHYPGLLHNNGTHSEWRDYAESRATNNFALSILSDQQANGSFTKRQQLSTAQELVSRFTFVLDISCLAPSIEAMAGILGVQLEPDALETHHHSTGPHLTPQQVIGYDDIYEFLLERNRLDIELFHWAKQRALVDCSSLS